MEWVSIMSDAFVGLSAVTVAILAYKGLTTWHREMKGKAKFEVGRRVVSLSLKIEGLFREARDPVASSNEARDRLRDSKETPEKSWVLDLAFVYNNRLSPVHKVLDELQELTFEASIIFDNETSSIIASSVGVYREQFRKLLVAQSGYFRVLLDQANGHATENLNRLLEERCNTIYGTSDDEFSRIIEHATERITGQVSQAVG